MLRPPWSAPAGAVRLLLAVALAGLLGLGAVPAASAHEGSPEGEGYILVQQAIGYLLDMPGPEAAMHAQEKVSAALAAADQEGVSVDRLRQAQSALEGGRADEARALLQESITDAVAALPPAKGLDTGTGTVLSPLGASFAPWPGWLFLALSVLAVGAGAWLAVLFRPREGVRALRREMGLAGRHRGQDGPEGDRR
jgi:hypothetical protein